MAAVQRLNHAVLYVKDAEVSSTFYQETLGFEVAHHYPGAVFLRAAGSANDHDLGLFSMGDTPGPQRGRRGLYHLAWQVDTIDELVAIREVLLARGAMVGESDHSRSMSLYAIDPDGVEFEVMWCVPTSAWTANGGGVSPLDLSGQVQRWSGVSTGHEANVGHLGEVR